MQSEKQRFSDDQKLKQFTSILKRFRVKHPIRNSFRVFANQLSEASRFIDCCEWKEEPVTIDNLGHLQVNHLQQSSPQRNSQFDLHKVILHVKFQNLSMLNLTDCHISNIEFLTHLQAEKLHNLYLQKNQISNIKILSKSRSLSKVASICMTDNFIKQISGLSRCFENPNSISSFKLFRTSDDFGPRNEKSQLQRLQDYVKLHLPGIIILFCGVRCADSIELRQSVKKTILRCFRALGSSTNFGM